MPPDLPAQHLKVALIGNPNTGKSTLFNALSGFRSQTGNYPGVTVEKKIGRTTCAGRSVDLIDLPGTYSLSPRTLDEMVAVDVLLGRQSEIGRPDVVVCIADASNLERNLYLACQVLDIGLPTILVLNMSDVASARGIRIDHAGLSQRLGIPVLCTAAHKQQGMDELREAIVEAAAGAAPPPLRIFPPAFHAECARLREQLTASGGSEWPEFLIERLLLDVGGSVEAQFVGNAPTRLQGELRDARQRLSDQGCRIPAIEARVRYQWVRQMLDGLLVVPAKRAVTASDKLDKFLTHKVSGLAVFALLMFLVFQSLYAWSQPLMEWCKAGQQGAVDVVSRLVPPGPLQSLLADGIIGGVGAVLVFLPQIAILFLFIAMLEDCGYMARAAFLMDRLMTTVGLSGKSFVPLMSSFACAVPGVMATRVIENRRDRLTTILIAPLMSCSARQPVYALMIGAFIPGTAWLGGWLTLPGLVLFVMTFLGAAVAVPIAWLLKRTLFRGETAPFVMELPSYKRPSLRNVLHRVYDSSKAFVQRAGTLICATTVLVWGAGYFPGDHSEAIRLQTQVEALTDNPQSHETLDRLTDELNRERARLLEESLLGRLGHAIEPVVRPLGWDWRIGVGVLASFPAREVIVGTLATIYSMGGADDPQDSGLQGAIRAAETPEGRPVYNIPVALSIMVFFALCAQCASTLMVIRRETNSWRWPLLTFTYMTGLAYVGAWAVFRLGMLWVG